MLNFYKSIRLTLVSLLLTCSACATLTSGDQKVMVDSAPRGQEFKTRNSENTISIYETPVTLEIPRDSSIRFDLPGGQIETRPCSFRVGPFLIGNLVPLAAALWPLSLAGYGIDLITGAAYECPQKILFRKDRKKAKSKKISECKKLYLFPPQIDATGKSAVIAKRWFKASNRREQLNCKSYTLSLSHPLTSDKYMIEQLGVNYRDLSFKQKQALAFETGTSHIVTMNRTRDGAKIQASVYDIYKDKKTFSHSFKSKLADGKSKSKVPGWKRFVRNNVHLISNSITLGGYNTDLDSMIVTKQYTRIDNVEDKADISLGITTALHPDGYSDWDFEVDFSPDFSFNTYSSKTFGTVFNERDEPLYTFESEVAGTTADMGAVAGFSLFTPFGRLAVGLGLGLFLSRTEDGANLEDGTKNLVTSYAGLSGTYEFFITDRIFFQTRASSKSLGSNLIDNEFYSVERFETYSFAFGYYFPETRKHVRSLL